MILEWKKVCRFEVINEEFEVPFKDENLEFRIQTLDESVAQGRSDDVEFRSYT